MSEGPRGEYDVVVVGSGYGGLIAAAILARAGRRVLVVDRGQEIGGTCRSVKAGEVYTPFGYAGSADTSDMFVLMSRSRRYGMVAAQRAGADVAFVGPIQPVMRVHVLQSGVVSSLGGGFADYAQEILGVPPDLVEDMRGWWKRLLQLDPDPLLNVPLSDWLAQLPTPVLRDAFARLAHIFDTLPTDRISTGRFVKGMQTPIELYFANDLEAPGMAGVAEAYGTAVRSHGGEFALGQDVVEAIVEDDRLTGITLQDAVSRVISVRTSTLVFAQLPDGLEPLFGRERLGDGFVDDARRLRELTSDIALEESVLSRLPVRRSDGTVEDYPGWSRILRGGDRTYGGGWWFPSLLSPGLAPEGKCTLEIGHASGGDDLKPFTDIVEARAAVARVHDYLSEYYLDLDEVTESRAFFVHRPPNIDSWKFAIAPRLPLVVPGVRGVFHVSAAADVDGVVQDIDANAAMQVVDLILAGGP